MEISGLSVRAAPLRAESKASAPFSRPSPASSKGVPGASSMPSLSGLSINGSSSSTSSYSYSSSSKALPPSESKRGPEVDNDPHGFEPPKAESKSSGSGAGPTPTTTKTAPTSARQPTGMKRASVWTPDVEESYRLQQVGFRTVHEYMEVYGEPERWASNNWLKTLRVKESGYYTYWREWRECEDKFVPRIKIFTYA
jgi:hypothetical protein